jgi:hypothetical protein
VVDGRYLVPGDRHGAAGRHPDPDTLRELVMGKPLDTARDLLAPCGESGDRLVDW